MIHDLVSRHGLILPGSLRSADVDARSLARDVDDGRLVKLRRGAYVESSIWLPMPPRERHILRVRAVLAVAERPAIIAGVSAAALWGMPIAQAWPDDVTVLDTLRSGGRSEPGVRRTACGFLTAETVIVEGVVTTSLARTAIDIARRSTFSLGVGSLDWALWRRNPLAISFRDLADELEMYEFRDGRRRAEALVRFATDLSDSFGESECRAVIHLLGFEEPELQCEVRDATGLMIPDFTWKHRKLGEFDGKLKYSRAMNPGGDLGEVVWREKQREDRLRRLGYGMSRFTTRDVKNPHRLEAILVDAGIPRRRGR